MTRRVVPVSRLVHYLKEYMDSDPVLHGVMIEGEVSNLRIPNSGHWYFSLKDDKASLTCVMFAYANRKIRFRPKNGDKVVLKGDVSVYESMGSMQMIVENMQPSGIGDLYLQLEALKKKLNAEGLFNAEHKKPLPKYPMDIALVTGSNTAAREDVLITFQKRWPLAEIHEYPAPVQGSEASLKIIEALSKADQGGHDVVILARGGGSLEDLWCFNDEALARFIYSMHTPIVTGIGHETDTTLVDYVSDVRANTPTGAVEIATPDKEEVQAALDAYRIRYINAVRTILLHRKNEFRQYRQSSVFLNPRKLINEKTVQVQYLSERMYRRLEITKQQRSSFNALFQRFQHSISNYSAEIQDTLKDDRSLLVLNVKRRIDSQRNALENEERRLMLSLSHISDQKKNDLARITHLLDAYSPLKVLERGYSVAYHEGALINSVKDVHVDDQIKVRLHEGALIAKVEEIEDE